MLWRLFFQPEKLQDFAPASDEVSAPPCGKRFPQEPVNQIGTMFNKYLPGSFIDTFGTNKVKQDSEHGDCTDGNYRMDLLRTFPEPKEKKYSEALSPHAKLNGSRKAVIQRHKDGRVDTLNIAVIMRDEIMEKLSTEWYQHYRELNEICGVVVTKIQVLSETTEPPVESKSKLFCLESKSRQERKLDSATEEAIAGFQRREAELKAELRKVVAVEEKNMTKEQRVAKDWTNVKEVVQAVIIGHYDYEKYDGEHIDVSEGFKFELAELKDFPRIEIHASELVLQIRALQSKIAEIEENPAKFYNAHPSKTSQSLLQKKLFSSGGKKIADALQRRVALKAEKQRLFVKIADKATRILETELENVEKEIATLSNPSKVSFRSVKKALKYGTFTDIAQQPREQEKIVAAEKQKAKLQRKLSNILKSPHFPATISEKTILKLDALDRELEKNRLLLERLRKEYNYSSSVSLLRFEVFAQDSYVSVGEKMLKDWNPLLLLPDSKVVANAFLSSVDGSNSSSSGSTRRNDADVSGRYRYPRSLALGVVAGGTVAGTVAAAGAIAGAIAAAPFLLAGGVVCGIGMMCGGGGD